MIPKIFLLSAQSEKRRLKLILLFLGGIKAHENGRHTHHEHLRINELCYDFRLYSSRADDDDNDYNGGQGTIDHRSLFLKQVQKVTKISLSMLCSVGLISALFHHL